MNMPQGGSFQDDDPDQWRLPQGSLFLELRSTRSPDSDFAAVVPLAAGSLIVVLPPSRRARHGWPGHVRTAPGGSASRISSATCAISLSL